MNVDIGEILRALDKSEFRRSKKLGPKDAEYLRAKGLQVVLQHARDFLTKRLAPAQPINDGKQTPWRGHPVFVAQHATATCCRSCVQEWHRIEKGRELTEEETEFLVQVIGAWLSSQSEG